MKDRLEIPIPMQAEFSLYDNQQVMLRFHGGRNIVIQLDTVNCPNMSAAFAELCWNNSRGDDDTLKSSAPSITVTDRYMGGDQVIECSEYMAFREKIVDKDGNIRPEDWRDSVLKKDPAHKWAIYHESKHPQEVKTAKSSTIQQPDRTHFVLTSYSNNRYVFGHVVHGDEVLDEEVGILQLEGCDYLNEKGYAVKMGKMRDFFAGRKHPERRSYGWKVKNPSAAQFTSSF